VTINGTKLSVRLLGATLALATCGLLTGNAQADTTYTTQVSFLADVAPGYYLETFDSLPTTYINSPLLFASGGFAYSAAAPTNFYPVAPDPGAPSDHALANNDANEPITITFTGAPVTAIGGNFFDNDENGYWTAGDITVTLSNATTVTLTGSAGNKYPFWGYTTTGAPITSLTVKSIYSGSTKWPTVNNLIVGSFGGTPPPAVPEPGAVAFGIIAAGSVLGLVARKRRS